MRTLFDAVDRLESALTFHRERHSVLAGNVANVDTPGYRPYDLVSAEEAAKADGAVPLQLTQVGHMNGVADAGGGEAMVLADQGSVPGLDGNTVSLERELAKIDANRVRYEGSSELVSRRLALLRYAAGDGSGG